MKFPSWFIKAIIIAGITVGVGGIGAWIGGVNSASAVNKVQDARIDAQEKRTDEVVGELREIKNVLMDRLPAPVTKYVYVPIKVSDKPRPKSDEEVLNGQ